MAMYRSCALTSRKTGTGSPANRKNGLPLSYTVIIFFWLQASTIRSRAYAFTQGG
ncbi:hypothetical protein SXCC_04637 [Gluconacetobacter sp. SXCC-1]|nr:hypothetical protein SXCC_04637 [Gluconacetobacter sp. SXCC-1]